ncbi:MAG: head-tail connector protein [Pseudomonadota bacterium]
MMLIEETAVPQAALPVDEFKAHLRLGTGFSDDDIQDAVLESFLRAALSAIEARTGKILITRNFSWVLSAWRDIIGQPLPVAPISEVTGMVMVTAAANASPVDADQFTLVMDMHRPVLKPTGHCLPKIPLNGTVEIDFIAGIGANWGELPADLGHAVLLLAAHYYEHRQEATLTEASMPYGVSSLIERYKNVRVLGGGALR